MLIDEMLAHAAEAFPNEACGLVVARGKKHRLIKAANLARKPREEFDLDPDAWLQVGDLEEVIGIYHSHPHGLAEPSLADLSGCEASGLPWHIVGLPSRDHRLVQPSGFRAPYLQRPYVYRVHDCYSLWRDWYAWELGIDLPGFEGRAERWWENGQNLFLDNIAKHGFVPLTNADPLQRGDVFLIQVNSRVPNHCAIYLGDGTILHHVEGRLSTRDPWGGFWAKHCTDMLRHNSKIGISING